MLPHEKILLSGTPRGHEFCLSIVYKRNPYYIFYEKARGERERNLNAFSGSGPGGKRERYGKRTYIQERRVNSDKISDTWISSMSREQAVH